MLYNYLGFQHKGEISMEPQVVFQERPRASVGGKVFLVLEMLALIFAKACTFISRLFLDDAASNMPSVNVMFWIVFFLYITGYILLLIGTSSRNSLGVLIAGFVVFLILEWETFITNFTSFAAFTERLTRLSAMNSIILFSFTFVWICLIVLTCVKKAPKPLCLIPGLIGVAASILQLYISLMSIFNWSSLGDIKDGKELAYIIFGRISSIIWLLVILFRPFWIFMVSHWLTHPTKKIPMRQGFRHITPQPYGMPVQGYQPVPNGYQQYPQYQQGYQQIPQQGYPQYGQPQQFPPQQ